MASARSSCKDLLERTLPGRPQDLLTTICRTPRKDILERTLPISPQDLLIRTCKIRTAIRHTQSVERVARAISKWALRRSERDQMCPQWWEGCRSTCPHVHKTLRVRHSKWNLNWSATTFYLGVGHFQHSIAHAAKYELEAFEVLCLPHGLVIMFIIKNDINVASVARVCWTCVFLWRLFWNYFVFCFPHLPRDGI